ncbi:MAG: hypothetical protein AAGD01_17550 [Acidobacteriota bacterium]
MPSMGMLNSWLRRSTTELALIKSRLSGAELLPLSRSTMRGMAAKAVLGSILLWVALLWSLGAPALAQGEAEEGAAQSLDRIVAVVDEDPVLASDVHRAVALGIVPRGPQEGDQQYLDRVLDVLVEQRLRFQAVERFGFEQVPVEIVEEQVAAVRARFEDEQSFAATLEALDMSVDTLAQWLTRQLMVLTYIEERLGPRVFISAEEVERYYREVLVPQLGSARGNEPPPLEEVRGQIRGVLREQRLNREIESWGRRLREEASIERYPDAGPAPEELPLLRRLSR